MVKKIKKYFEWLFQGNILKYKKQDSHNLLVLEGKSWVFWKVILNSCVSLCGILLPLLGVSLQLKNPFLLAIFIILPIASFIIFSVGIIAIAYQPFWIHKNMIIFQKDRLYTRNSIGLVNTYYSQNLNSFTIRFDFVQSGIVNLQFWIDDRKQYFVNAFVLNFAKSEVEVFDLFKNYMEAWGLEYIDMNYSPSSRSGKFIFKRQGKTKFSETLSFDELKKKSEEAQVQVGEELELIAGFSVSGRGNSIQITRPEFYKYKMWGSFLLSFFGGGIAIACTIYALIYLPSNDNTGIYVFLVIVGLLWIILSLAFYMEANSNLLLKVDSKNFYVQHKNGKGQNYQKEQIEALSLKGVIFSGRFTTISGKLYLNVKKKNFSKRILLISIDSDRPEKLDTQLVRDNVYARSMRIAQLTAKPMGLPINWEGFK